MNRLIITKEIESLIKKNPKKHNYRTKLNCFTDKFCLRFKELIPVILKLFQKLKWNYYSKFIL